MTIIEAAREKIQACIQTLYFPEVWYLTESWLQLAKNKTVLTVGAGVGQVAEAFARTGWKLTCVDPSAKLLTDLRDRFDEENLSGDFEQVEFDNLPYANKSFEHVVCINSVELANPAHVVREVARVLAPGGRGVIATFNKLSPWGIPAVARALRPEGEQRAVRFCSRDEFERVLAAYKLKVDSIKERAAYLPGAARAGRIKLPVPGSFVALIEKSSEPKPTEGGKPKRERPPG